MQLTTIAIKRPLFMLMVISALLVVGLVSWTRLGVNLLPALDFPIVVVSTTYPGASPEAVDTLVTRKVEDAVASINDIDYIQSTSVEGNSTVVIFFTDRAAKDSSNEVERRVNAIRNTLPQDIIDPSVGKFDPAAQPIMQLSMSGTRDLGSLQQLAEDKLQKRLQSTSGVGQVNLIGGLEREIQVQVDQQRLQARGLSILQVNQALAGDNLNVPAGSITQQGRSWTVRLDNQAQTPQQLNNILVTTTEAGPVYLRDVATVVDTYKKVNNIQRNNGQAALGITILKQASANTVQTADEVKKTLAEVDAEMPPDVETAIASDASIFTRSSITDVQSELVTAVLLTGLVLLVFLHSFRSTLIVLLAIPTSLVATLGVMYFMGLSFNMMSLMGLTLTVGILVDDSIVVLENIFRHLQMGEGPREAAINGRGEIGFAAIAITLVDVVVFAPIAFMSGIVGQYFREFGLVVVAATLFSLFVSFTLTPLLASRWFKAGEGEADKTKPTRNPLVLFGRAWDSGYERVARGYGRVLGFAVGRWTRWAVVGLGILSFVGGIMLITTGVLSTEFFPVADGGKLSITLEMPPGSSIEVTNAATQRIEQKVMAWPEVKEVFTSVGVGGAGGLGGSRARFANISVELIEKDHRTRTPMDLAEEARTFGNDIPGARVSAANVDEFGGGGAQTPINVRVQGEDSRVLAALATQVAEAVRNVPGTRDVSDGGVTGEPELVVSIDRQQAADLGLTPAQVGSVLRTGLAGSTVSTFRPEGTSGWDINVILNPNERDRLSQVAEIPIVTPRGATIRLGQIAQITPVSGPSQITRRDRQRSVYVTAALSGRVVGDVARDVQTSVDQIQVPAGYTITQGGEAEEQAEVFGQMFLALGLSVLLMYMLMVALFESMVYPLMIMFSLPLAVVGAFGLLAATGNTLNMMSMIGLILLMGLVGKNAILLVDYTNTLRKRGLPRNEAIKQAGPVRLRPILMTTSALVLAMLPIATAVAEGSEWRAPMAITVIGGLLTSSLLTLILIPAVYTILDDFGNAMAKVPGKVRSLVRRPARTHTEPGKQEEPERKPARMPIPVGGGSD